MRREKKKGKKKEKRGKRKKGREKKGKKEEKERERKKEKTKEVHFSNTGSGQFVYENRLISPLIPLDLRRLCAL